MVKSEIQTIHNEIREAIEMIAKKHGLEAMGSNIRYSDVDMEFKIKLNILSQDSGEKLITSDSQKRAAFALIGTGATTDEPLGKTYDFEGIGKATIIDYVSRRSKYPFTVKTPAGQRYKVSATSVAKASRFGDHGYNK